MSMGISWNEYRKELMKDPEFVKEYEALEPEYELTRLLISQRIKRGLTQKELAERMNTTQSVISRLENGSANPSLATLKRLANALDARLVVRFE